MVSNNVYNCEDNENDDDDDDDDDDKYILDKNKCTYIRPNQMQAACMFQCINSSHSSCQTQYVYSI